MFYGASLIILEVVGRGKILDPSNPSKFKDQWRNNYEAANNERIQVQEKAFEH